MCPTTARRQGAAASTLLRSAFTVPPLNDDSLNQNTRDLSEWLQYCVRHTCSPFHRHLLRFGVVAILTRSASRNEGVRCREERRSPFPKCQYSSPVCRFAVCRPDTKNSSQHVSAILTFPDFPRMPQRHVEALSRAHSIDMPPRTCKACEVLSCESMRIIDRTIVSEPERMHPVLPF